MIVDKTNTHMFNYSYALIQYRNISTIENYNFGIILKDESGQVYFHIPTLPSAVDTCLDLNNKPAINYTLEKVRHEIENLSYVNEGNISDALSISLYRSFTTGLSPSDALSTLVQRYITLKKMRVLEKNTSLKRYDKRNIVKLIDTYAKERKIENFRHNQKFSNMLKSVELSLVDKEDNPFSIATVSSPHVEHFHDSFITNIFTLQEAQRNGIGSMFLHAPTYTDIKSKHLDRNKGWAHEQAQHYKFEIVFDTKPEAVMERLQAGT